MLFNKTQHDLGQYDQFMRTTPFAWGDSYLRVRFQFEKGVVKSESGNVALAIKPLIPTLTVERVLKDSNNNVIQVIEAGPELVTKFGIDISYNCFSYCFGGGKVWIEDPSSIIVNEYEEVQNIGDAEVIVFKEWRGFDDYGINSYSYLHGVKVEKNGFVSFKPGVNSLVEKVLIEMVSHRYDYNRKVYLRKKRR